jgi:tetratricopeptide (TPR) repeat protein
MKNIWLSIALILIALVTSLLGVFKDAFLSGRVPRWVFFTMAILPIMAAALQIYQDVASQKLQKGAHRLISDITPQSDPLLLSTEQQELLMSITNKISKVQPGKSKLFVAPNVSSNTFYNLGLIFFNQRDFVQSEKYLSAALKADKNNVAAVNLLLLLYQSSAMNHLNDGEIEGAESSLKKAEKLMDNLPAKVNLKTLTLLAYVYKSLGQLHERTDHLLSEQHWDKAEKIFETVLISNKKDPSALNGIGNVFHHKRKFNAALKKYKEALEVAPYYAAAANDAAIVCENLMKHDSSQKEAWKTKAIEYWKLAVKLSKDDPQFPPEYGVKVTNRIQWLYAQ